MPSTLAAITIADVKAYFGVTDTNKDTVLTAVLPLVVDYVKEYTNNDFESTTRTAEKPVIQSNSDSFFLKYRPVASITSLTEDTISLTENTHYWVDNDSGCVEKYSSNIVGIADTWGAFWTTKPKAISVTYVGGEALTQDVVMVVYELCGIRSGIKTRTYTDNQGVEATATINSVPAELMQILDNHRVFTV